MKRILGLFLAISLLCFACTKKEEKRFEKLASSDTNVKFKNELKDTPELNILTYLYYYNGAGVAAGDFNNDGMIDLYFTANQTEDQLYINKGDFVFENSTKISNISNDGNWTTGVTHVDINQDGLLDIYICKVGNYGSIKGKNLLYVNQGNNAEGLPLFKEDAAAYGLDFSGFSTQAAFFDYDLDGDLDMYLLNHSTHPNRNYGKGSLRTKIDSLAGDRFYRNENQKYIDASEDVGIFSSKIGYGLGLSITDINNDGYPDMYIGNDFFENDYLYINQKDGTFEEVISNNNQKLGHTTHFSMGNDIADINNDGLTDIVSLDMLPEDLETYKTSGLEYAFPTYQYYLKNGYAPQYMQNTLHLNLGNENFSEIGHLSGISATEWSWGALLADFDNDGFKDLYVSNGIKGATNDMDFINFIANDNIQKRIAKGMSKEDLSFIREMPQKKVANYFFKNNGDLSFKNTTESWSKKEVSFSNGSTYADLDNDGDLDLVVNNVDEEAYILKNKSSERDEQTTSISLTFKGAHGNRHGIGAKVIAYTPSGFITQENYSTRGYLSASPKTMHIGLGKHEIIDSLKVIWPGGAYQSIPSVPTNQKLIVDIKNALDTIPLKVKKRPYLIAVDSIIPFVHSENPTVEFDREPLVPFANSNQGPSISVVDFNADGLDDFFISGAKRQASALFIQEHSGSFKKVQESLFSEDLINEDVSHVFFDATGNGFLDLLVVSGGNEFKSGEPLRPRLYMNKAGILEKDHIQFANFAINASKVSAVDFDADGDLDICISSDQVPQQFGKTPKQYLFQNNGKGSFEDVTKSMAPTFQNLGTVKDMVWVDLDANGYKDLIAIGHWIPISIFLNDGEQLKLQQIPTLEKTHGWWNAILAEDLDNDGDLDMVVGNWGENSKFKASVTQPVRLYNYDFDDNGSMEPLVTYYHKNKETPFASKDELVKQLPYLNKKFLSYQSFAKASLEDLFSEEKLNNASKKEVYLLASCYFENMGDGTYTIHKLPNIAQASSIHALLSQDFNQDGIKEVFIAGNNHEISTQLGRLDASHGLILRHTKNKGLQNLKQEKLDILGAARDIKTLKIQGVEHYIIGINNDAPIFLKKNDD